MGNSQANSSIEENGQDNKIKSISNIHMKLMRFKKRSKKNLQVKVEEIPPSCEPKKQQFLSVDDTKNIQDTLHYVNMHMHEILNEAFLNMFSLNPDIKEKFFAFKDATIEDLRQENDGSRALARHVPRVSRAMIKILSKLDDLDSVIDYLKVLGKIHHQNGIQVS